VSTPKENDDDIKSGPKSMIKFSLINAEERLRKFFPANFLEIVHILQLQNGSGVE